MAISGERFDACWKILFSIKEKPSDFLWCFCFKIIINDGLYGTTKLKVINFKDRMVKVMFSKQETCNALMLFYVYGLILGELWL